MKYYSFRIQITAHYCSPKSQSSSLMCRHFCPSTFAFGCVSLLPSCAFRTVQVHFPCVHAAEPLLCKLRFVPLSVEPCYKIYASDVTSCCLFGASLGDIFLGDSRGEWLEINYSRAIRTIYLSITTQSTTPQGEILLFPLSVCRA